MVPRPRVWGDPARRPVERADLRDRSSSGARRLPATTAAVPQHAAARVRAVPGGVLVTYRETLSLVDALTRLRDWKHSRDTELSAARTRADLWRHRATAQSERAHEAEREVRRLHRRNREL